MPDLNYTLTLKDRVELCAACGAMRRELQERLNGPRKWYNEDRIKERLVELDRLAKLMLDGPSDER